MRDVNTSLNLIPTAQAPAKCAMYTLHSCYILRIPYIPCTICKYEKVKIIIVLPLNIEDNKTDEGYLVWSHLAYAVPSKHVTERETEVTERRRSRRKQLQEVLKRNRRYQNLKEEALEQCFSTAGPQPGTGPWHQLNRAARGSPGICQFSFLSIFHEQIFYSGNILRRIILLNVSKSSDTERLNNTCVANVSDQDFISPVTDN